MSPSSPARQPLSDDSIDQLLRSVADAAEQAATDHAAAVRHYRDLSTAAESTAAESTAAERMREQDPASGRPIGGLRLDPLASLTVQRVLLAESLADEYEEAAQKFIAWWVDLAVCAVLALLTDVPLTRGRAAAGDPSSCMEPDELVCLPPVPRTNVSSPRSPSAWTSAGPRKGSRWVARRSRRSSG
ncbi:hypothetical protein [Nonomuraea guangzhouensis]|uniref:Uncharacterized protein n=1 Tax=Nonomuraea guangzhouensis TaxID=1291555 RepID=A0ABW4GHW0_9ACTN|nr:hypothetical protein [Nonomuraea guangzhouensis]